MFKNILIIGFGRIGKSLIKRCLGFEMNVYVYDPFVSKEDIESLGGKKIEDLKEGVKKMDAISLHIPLNEKTKNIVNHELLKNFQFPLNQYIQSEQHFFLILHKDQFHQSDI